MTKNISPSHQAELAKLNRIAGQVEGIKKMIEDRRYCPEIITQLRAVRAALRTVETNILETHLQSCVADAMMRGDKKQAHSKIEELKDLLRRFDD